MLVTGKDCKYEPRHKKTGFCLCENKDADQLCGNPEADQGLCFRYTDSTIPLLPKSKISSLYPSSVAVQSVCVGPGRKPQDRFSHKEAHIISENWFLYR